MLTTPEQLRRRCAQGLDHARLGRAASTAASPEEQRKRSTTTSTCCSRRARRARRCRWTRTWCAACATCSSSYPAGAARLQPPEAPAQLGARHPAVQRGRRRPVPAPLGVRARQRQAAHRGRAGPVHLRRLPQGASRPRSTVLTRQLAAEDTVGARPASRRRGESLRDRQAEPGALTDRVRRLYLEEYIKVWDKYIADVRLVKLDSLEKSLQVARLLSGVDSPLARVPARRGARDDPGRAQGRRSARPAAPRSATSTRRPSRPSARWRRCSARSRCRAPSRADGAAAREDGRRSLRADAPPRRRHAAADRRDHEDLQRGLRAARGGRRGAEEQVGAAAGRRRRALKAAAGRLPEPARSVLEKVAGAAASLGQVGRARGPDQELKPISEFCNRAIAGRYPFASSSKADVLPEDFGQMFGAGGVFDDFFSTSWRRWSTPAPTPGATSRPATAPSRSTPRRWSTSSARRASRTSSSAAAARRRRSRSTSGRSRWKTA